jgi:hypothetical protein
VPLSRQVVENFLLGAEASPRNCKDKLEGTLVYDILPHKNSTKRVEYSISFVYESKVEYLPSAKKKKKRLTQHNFIFQ